MRSNLKATRILLIDTSLVLAISIVLVTLNLLMFNRVNSSLTQIDQTRLHKLKLVRQMKQIIRERSLVMLDMASEHDVWAFQDKYLKFHGLANEFISVRKNLVETGLTAIEKQKLEKALSTIRYTEPLQDGIVERIRAALMEDQNIERIHYEIAGKDFPLEFSLLGQMESLHEQIVDESNRQRTQIKNDYERNALTLSIVSFFLILTIIGLMSRSLRKISKIETGLIEQAESQSWDATHDPLTNVFNRRWLEHKIDFLLDKTLKEGIEHSLLYLDLDGFKAINDAYGHRAGDDYLTRFCREVEHTIRLNDTFCRMGGDEFAILLENCSKEVSLRIANELLYRIRKFSIEFNSSALRATCSIGLCFFNTNEIEFDDLVHRADELCYEAKRKGKDRVESGDFE
ncbi:MAG: GGDEF domain-containing protein [Acidiferrobacterales bacterium]